MFLPQTNFQHPFHRVCIVKQIDQKSIWLKTFLKMNNSQNQKTWILFSSLARAHAEHMLATRFWQPRTDDELDHTTITIIIIIILVPINKWLNIDFAANGFPKPILLHLPCQIQRVGDRFYLGKHFSNWINPNSNTFGPSLLHSHEHTQSTC